MKYEALNQKIIELIGGKDNIVAVAHCVTRLRLTLKDRSLAKTKEIKKLDGVIDVVSNDVAYQIVIGTHVSDVYQEFMQMTGSKSDASIVTNQNKKFSIKGSLHAILVVVSETMSSIVEVLLAAGLLAGFLALFSLLGIISPESPTYQILDTLRVATFHFLPVLIAASAAKRLNVNPYVAMVIAVTLLSSSIDGVEGLSLFGISLQTITYANSFIPILLAVWVLSLVTKGLNRIIPKYLQYFLVPILSMVIVLSLTLVFFGPIGDWIGSGLNVIFEVLRDTIGNWIVVTLYAAFQPFLIVFGAGNFTAPIILNFLNDPGYDPIILHAATISDIAVAGAMFGYFLRAKQNKEKQFFGTVSFSAIMGITEPAVFGAFLKYRRPFIAVIVGGGVGGLIAGLSGVKTYAYVWGLVGLPSYLHDGNTMNFIFMLISVIVGFVVATIVAYGIGIPKDIEVEDELENQDHIVKSIAIDKIADGTIQALDQVADKAFASSALGNGIAIVPQSKLTKVYTPVEGVVSVVFPSKHAYGIVSDEGIEILIHIGIDTVHLDGKGFDSFVEQGDRVIANQLLASYDVETVIDAGLDPTIMVVITNTNTFLDVLVEIDQSEPTLQVII